MFTNVPIRETLPVVLRRPNASHWNFIFGLWKRYPHRPFPKTSHGYIISLHNCLHTTPRGSIPERENEKKLLEKKSFRNLSYTKAVFAFPPSTVLGEIYVTKRGGDPALRIKVFFFLSVFLCPPPFRQRLFTFWLEEKKNDGFCFFPSHHDILDIS